MTTAMSTTGSVSDFTVQNVTADLSMDCFREAVGSLRFQPFEQPTFLFDWRLE
jgi:hypothetical protein